MSAGLAVLGAGIGATASGLGSIIGGLFDSRNTDKTNQANKNISNATNEYNYKIAQETNATNERIAQENLGFQRENLDYQKALQQQIFAREDSALQRTVADAKAAGISPLAAIGTADGAGAVIETQPLNNGYQAQSPAASTPYQEQSFLPGASIRAAFEQASQVMQYGFERDMQEQELELAKADSNAKNAAIQQQLLESQARIAKMEEELRRSGESHQHELAISRLDEQYKALQNQFMEMQNNWYREQPETFSHDRLGDTVAPVVKQLLGATPGTPTGKAVNDAIEKVLSITSGNPPDSVLPHRGKVWIDGLMSSVNAGRMSNVQALRRLEDNLSSVFAVGLTDAQKDAIRKELRRQLPPAAPRNVR